MIWTDDIQRPNGLSSFWIILALFVDHVQLHSKFAVRIGDYGIWKSARDILAV